MMNSTDPVPVTVTRTTVGWSVHVPDRPLRLARQRMNLIAIESQLAALYRPTHGADVTFIWSIRTGDDALDGVLCKLHEAQQLTEQISEWVLEVLRHPTVRRLSNRDAGFLVGLSHQRVKQLRDAMSMPPGSAP